MDSREVLRLLKKRNSGTLSEAETAFLESWYVHHAQQAHHAIPEEELQQNVERLRSSLPVLRRKKDVKFFRWMYAAAALSIGLLLAGLTYYKAFLTEENLIHSLAHDAEPILPASGDVLLTTGDGKQLALMADKAGIRVASGKLLYQDGSSLHKDLPNSAMPSNSWHSLRTAIGRQYELILADGTKVWLNASTTLRYPVNFSDKSREVELQGEAYFEVAKDAKRPFMVRTAQQQVQVLGTHFNISSYANDRAEETSLFEGAVVIVPNAKADKIALKPGQQAIVQGEKIKLEKLDEALVLDWKQGQFQFDDTSLESIMHKLARWYAIDVKYEAEYLKAEPFYGIVSRKSPLQEVLRILTLAGDVKFEIIERTVMVRKK